MRNYLKNVRRERGLTRQAVAEHVGISAHYYCMIEQGSRQGELSLMFAVKLSEVLQVPLARIVEEEMALRKEA